MTTEQMQDIIKMRTEGKTMQKIADKYGVSKQRISQILHPICIVRGPYHHKKIQFKNIEMWMKEQGMSIPKFAERMRMYASTLRDKLTGRGKFKLDDIELVLQITGMNFETAFHREPQQEE